MKRQSSLSSWISKAKKPASLDGNDECNDETDSLGYLAESRLTDSDSCSAVNEESDNDPEEYNGDKFASTCTSTITVVTSASSEGVEKERQRSWCEVFRKKDRVKGPKRKFVRCKICISYPSIVSIQFHPTKVRYHIFHCRAQILKTIRD